MVRVLQHEHDEKLRVGIENIYKTFSGYVAPCLARNIDAVDLKYRLGNVETYCRDRLHG
jgi:hypothetical protein